MTDAIFARRHVRTLSLRMDQCSNDIGQGICTALRVNSGTIQAGSLNSAVLPTAASSVSGAYTNMALHLYSGVGSGQTVKVTSYDGPNRRAYTTFVTAPVSGTLYTVINRPVACYKTFATCLDRANYAKGQHTYKFSTVGAPILVGDTVRPYIKSLSDAATEVRVEGGLADRGTVTAMLYDETDNDTEMDPYVDYRLTAAQGSFFTRFVKRNPNYAGREAIVQRGYLTTSAWVSSEFTDELYAIDQFKGPDKDGMVSIILKDPLKFSDRVKVPTITSGKLLSVFNPNDSTFQVNSGEGAQYSDFDGFVRIGDQVIQYSGKTIPLGWNFTDTADGWTSEQGSLSTGAEVVTFTASSLGAYMLNNSMALDGLSYRYIAVRLKRTSFVGSWVGKLTYATGVHSFDFTNYYKQVSQPSGIDSDYITVTFDMHALDVGSMDWRNTTVRGLKFEFGANSGGSYAVDWVAYSVGDTVTADTFRWPSSTYRSKFFTTASSQKVGDGVQQCLVYSDAYVTSVMQDLAARVMPNSYIDTAMYTLEETNWLGDKYRVNACLSEPLPVSTYLKELCVQTNGVNWFSPTAQKLRYRVIAPPSPADISSNMLTDDNNLIDDTVVTSRLEDLRLTTVSVRYNLASATADPKQDTSYLSSATKTDSSAASPNEYGDDRSDIIYSRWFTNSNDLAMRTLATRRLALFRDAPDEIEFMLDPKDDAVNEATFWDLTTSRLVDFAGAPLTNRSFVLKRQLQENGRIKIKVRVTPFSKRYMYIAPASLANYASATSLNRYYGYISNSAGFMSDGTSGYLII